MRYGRVRGARREAELGGVPSGARAVDLAWHHAHPLEMRRQAGLIAASFFAEILGMSIFSTNLYQTMTGIIFTMTDMILVCSNF